MFILLIALVCGLIGGFIASSKGKNVFLWFLLCSLFPLIGLVILLLSKSNHSPAQQVVYMQPAPTKTAAAPALPTEPYDIARWNTLVDYDPELRNARNRLASYGSAYVERLAKDFLTVNDKQYLAAMVERIEDQARIDQEVRRAAPVRAGMHPGISYKEYPDRSVVGTFDSDDRTFSSMRDFKSAAFAAAKSFGH